MRGERFPGLDDRDTLPQPTGMGNDIAQGLEGPSIRQLRAPGVPTAEQAAAMGRIIAETNARRKHEREVAVAAHAIAAASLSAETLSLL